MPLGLQASLDSLNSGGGVSQTPVTSRSPNLMLQLSPFVLPLQAAKISGGGPPGGGPFGGDPFGGAPCCAFPEQAIPVRVKVKATTAKTL